VAVASAGPYASQSTEGIRALEAKTVNNNKWGVTVKMAAACNCSLA